MTTCPAPSSSAWAVALRLAFLAGDLGQAIRIVQEAVEVVPPLDVLDEIAAPALREVGTLWERDTITIADEHLATATALRLLAAVAPLLRTRPPHSRGRLAVLATPPSEQHTTALLMLDEVLRGAGFRVANLGGGVPIAPLVTFVRRERPALVALSATMSHPEELIAAIDALSEIPGTRVLVGGQRVPPTLPPRAERVADLRDVAAALSL